MEIAAPRATLTVDACLRLLEATLAHGRAAGHAIWVAVADGSGELMGLIGCEGAPRISAQVAIDKAFTAVATGRPTSAWKAWLIAAPEEEREIARRFPRYVGADGGHPIVHRGLVIGGLGVSGANQVVDEECARAGLAAIGAPFPS
jgi:uncharacterized protein GlcG (DUF336 family)